MQIYIHQTHHQIANFSEIFSYLKELSTSENFQGNIHLFPELFLCGYPLQDLCFQRDFIQGYHEFFEELKVWWQGLDRTENTSLLLGGLDYTFDDLGNPKYIENSIFELSSQAEMRKLYSKRLLPNYDIFDEAKYFKPGQEAALYQFNGKTFGLLICEDMWASDHYDVDPVSDLLKLCSGKEINGVFNLSASPFHIGKESSRIARVKQIYESFNVPYYYANRVGSEDEIVFDGGSFIFSEGTVSKKALSFKQDIISAEVQAAKVVDGSRPPVKLDHSWESLFTPRLEVKEEHLRIKELSDQECEEILHALNLGIQDYARKCGMKNFLVALSGGMDSALVIAMLGLFKQPDQTIEAVYMPGQFSATLSWEISQKICKNLNIKLTSLPIKFLHSTVRNQFRDTFTEMEGLADENIQSRLRGALIYARSNQTGAMVLNTSNKSELSVGYSTLYGDSVGAISPLGDLFKTEVFTLAKYINKKFGDIIPIEVIERPPSAELRENQEDSHSLPPYEILDTILEGHLSYSYSQQDLIDASLPAADVTKVYRLCKISEYKRFQFCPIIKLKAKSFGFGRRMPITKYI
ncbi:NAD(+) synthase [Bacteriovorax sp. Seq25_V]|uniref:NAD(+) synthase n=1 Tax=Bacteriovorax sp. Seq25_V TaxID=1201288 RepID=UPI000389E905|nr:NAD(+) synthase [Bacteriovorax sp. Seq25_V]EQC43874.1 NAD+ synthetase [Bacteriovorax sp. Seq25_V]